MDFFFFALALFVYIYRLVVKVPGFYYAEGMYLYITAQNAGSMFIYGFLGALLSILIQKNDKKTKNIMLIGTAIIGIAVIATFYAIGANYTKALKINIIIALIICLLLSGGGFILELLVSKKKKKLITQDN